MGTFGIAIVIITVALGLAALAGLIQIPGSTAKFFASRVSRTIGGIALSNSGSPLNSIQVHALGPADPPEWVGLTIQTGNIGTGRPTAAVTLSIAEATQLSELLAEATKRPDPSV